MKNPTIAIVMAGGSGERFWPLSRRKFPKQLLKLTDEHKTMLEESVERIQSLIPPERILIATSTILVDAIKEVPIPTEVGPGSPMTDVVPADSDEWARTVIDPVLRLNP